MVELTIQQIADKAGVTVATLRFYERKSYLCRKAETNLTIVFITKYLRLRRTNEQCYIRY
ncbi:MAG: MerR family DNA-binding transcriptional regulator [Gammaproteobacteria bacterium]|nr:MAG: MerR family DNA-binding transcriptional regulator [Gammaproteobacteria bacterium]